MKLDCRRILIALIAAATMPGFASAAELSKEPLSKVKENVEAEKAVLVDVREKKEWDAGHVKGAVFLPLSEVENGLSKSELAKLPKDKELILYIHCVIGKRAVTAGNVLEKYGYKVRPIEPGYKELIAAGFPKDNQN